MGATRESPSLTDAAELDELRRRAYGPGADIAEDENAIARLAELELLLGHGHAPIAFTAPEPLTATVSTLDPVAEIPAHTVATQVRPSTTPPRRRRASVIAAGIAVVLVLAAVTSTLAAGSSDVTLHRRAEIPQSAVAQLRFAGELGYLGIALDDVRLYDDFRGLNVWSALRGSSTICLFVTSSTRPRWRVDCTPRDGEPTIDLVAYRDGSRLAGLEALGDVPEGSVLRLVLRGGAVVAGSVESGTTAIGE